MAVGTIGKYERLDVLGHGASGVVYLAWDSLLRRQVALKEIRADAVEMERVLEEARVLDRLSHPNIVRVHGVDREGGVILIDMELVRGRTLSEIMRQRSEEGTLLPATESIRIALAVLDALGYAHEKRIVHRDIKPANILLGNDGTVKLTDFGLAEALGTGSVAGGGGTYPYMAPEDFAENDASDYRSDLWAVGVVLYEMLTGRRPFAVTRAKDPFAWKRAIEHDEPPSLSSLRPELPSSLNELFVRALAKDKVRRFATARLFADALRAVSFTATEATAVLPPETVEENEDPSVFVFPAGAVCYTLDELLKASARHWDAARTALLSGRFERFLRAIGEVYIADLSSELAARGRLGENPDRILREFLTRSQPEEDATPEERPGLPIQQRTKHLLRRVPRPRVVFETPADEEHGEMHTVAIPASAPPPAPKPEPAREEPSRRDRRAEKQERHRERMREQERQKALRAAEKGKEGKPVLRWWFFPVLALCVTPPTVALVALVTNRMTYAQMGAYSDVMEGWSVTGLLSAMLLLVTLGVNLPNMARVMAFVPLAVGLLSSGALASAVLNHQPKPEGMILIGIALVASLIVLLFQAATMKRLWRFWLGAVIGLSLLAILYFGRALWFG